MANVAWMFASLCIVFNAVNTLAQSTTTTTQPTTTTRLTTTMATTLSPYDCEILPCPSGFVCDSYYGQCICEDEVNTVLDYDNMKCRPIVGANCLVNDADAAPCFGNSICIPTNTTHGRCECPNGLIPNKYAMCSFDIGRACDDSYVCNDWYHLVCRNGKCACPSPYMDYEVERGCVARVGERCYVSNNPPIQCVTGSACFALSVGESRCVKCEPGGNC